MVIKTLDDSVVKACEKGDLEAIKKVVPSVYSVNDYDSTRKPLILHAIKNNHFPIVKWLVENGADVNIWLQSPVDFNDSESLLVWCTDRMGCKNPEITQYLISKGAVKKY